MLPIQRYVYTQYSKCASKRGFSFNLTADQFLEIANQPCVYCTACATNTATRKQYSVKVWCYNGIDRVNSSLSYGIGNVVACCKACNAAKSDSELSTFLAGEWLRNRVAMIKGE